MDGNWIEEAIAKKHSTMIEAVAVSKLMNCPKLILTHFSSRYGISNNCVPKMNCKVVLITWTLTLTKVIVS